MDLDFNISNIVYNIITKNMMFYEQYDKEKSNTNITFDNNIIKNIDTLLQEIYIHPLDYDYLKNYNKNISQYYYNLLALNYTTLKKEFVNNFKPIEYKNEYIHMCKMFPPHTRDLIYYRLNNDEYKARVLGGYNINKIPKAIKSNNYYLENFSVPGLSLVFQEWLKTKSNLPNDISIQSIYYPVILKFLNYKKIIYNNNIIYNEYYNNDVSSMYMNYNNKINLVDIKISDNNLNINLNKNTDKHEYLIKDLFFDINNIISDSCNFKNILRTIHNDLYYFIYYYDLIIFTNTSSYFKNYIINFFINDKFSKNQLDTNITKIFLYININRFMRQYDIYSIIDTELNDLVKLFKESYSNTQHYKPGDINNYEKLIEFFILKLDILMITHIVHIYNRVINKLAQRPGDENNRLIIDIDNNFNVDYILINLITEYIKLITGNPKMSASYVTLLDGFKTRIDKINRQKYPGIIKNILINYIQLQQFYEGDVYYMNLIKELNIDVNKIKNDKYYSQPYVLFIPANGSDDIITHNNINKVYNSILHKNSIWESDEDVTNTFITNLLALDGYMHTILNTYEHHIKKILYKLGLESICMYNNIDYTHESFISLLYIIYDKLAYIIHNNESNKPQIRNVPTTSTSSAPTGTNVGASTSSAPTGTNVGGTIDVEKVLLSKNDLSESVCNNNVVTKSSIFDIPSKHCAGNVTIGTQTDDQSQIREIGTYIKESGTKYESIGVQTDFNVIESSLINPDIHYLFWDGIEYNTFNTLPIQVRNILLNLCIPFVLYKDNHKKTMKCKLYYKESDSKIQIPYRICFIPYIYKNLSLYSLYMDVSKHIYMTTSIKNKITDKLDIDSEAYHNFIEKIDTYPTPLQVVIRYTYYKKKQNGDNKVKNPLALTNKNKLEQILKILDKLNFKPVLETHGTNKIKIITEPSIVSRTTIEQKMKSDPNYNKLDKKLIKILLDNIISLKNYLTDYHSLYKGGIENNVDNDGINLNFKNDAMLYINSLDNEFLNIENVDEFKNYDPFLDEKNFYNNRFLEDINNNNDMLTSITNNIPPSVIKKMQVYPHIEKFLDEAGATTISELLDTVDEVTEKSDEYNPLSLIIEGLGVKTSPSIITVSAIKERIDNLLQEFNTYPTDPVLCKVRKILSSIVDLKHNNPVSDDIIENLKTNILEYFRYRYKLYYYLISIGIAVEIYRSLSYYYDKEELTDTIIYQIMEQLKNKTKTYTDNNILSLKNILNSIYKDKSLSNIGNEEFIQEISVE